VIGLDQSDDPHRISRIQSSGHYSNLWVSANGHTATLRKHDSLSHSREESPAMQVSHVINPGKLLMLTQTPPNEPQVLHSISATHMK
jgi:hypothetical protein